MAYIEGTWDFGSTAITTSNTATVSTNVTDEGSAKKVFAGATSTKIKGQVKLSAGSGTLSIRAQFVGADDAGLSTNAEVLADTGIHLTKEDGTTALANTDTFRFQLTPSDQRSPKRYYGMIYTLGGTSPSATCDGRLVIDGQTNMQGARAAVPA